MPLLVRCDELQPGMRLAEAIIHRGRTMLSGGKVLTSADAEILGRKMPELTVRVVDPVLDNVIEFEDDSREREVSRKVATKVAGAMEQVGERFSARASLTGVNFKALAASVGEITEYLKSNPVSAALLARCLDTESYLADHAGNVFYLSMVLGAAVRDYVVAERERQSTSRVLQRRLTMNLTPLGLGAMLIDLGMLPLRQLFKVNRMLTPEESAQIREHPLAGAATLPEDLSPVAKMVVRTHHENCDGTGYPTGLSRNKLHVFARIVRVADAFDAATAVQVYKEAKSPARALWEMSRGPYRRFYDPVLIKVFCRLIQPFPIGARLRLVDGRYAVVVRYNRQEPFLPTVVIAQDAGGNRLPPDRLEGPLSLAERRDLRIRAFGGENLAYIFDDCTPQEEACPHKELHTLFDAAFP